MIGRILRSTDFERVLRTRSRSSSAHFALHHLPICPGAPRKPSAPDQELSTGMSASVTPPVDESCPAGVWMGTVVPKRHARKAVTRNLIRRQIRAVVTLHARALPAGLWVVRLRSPFDRADFHSASSDKLKRVARAELESVLAGAAPRALER